MHENLDFLSFTLMRVTWETNPAHRNSRLTNLPHSHGDTTVNIVCIRSNKDDQIENTLWWEPESLIKNILRQYKGISPERASVWETPVRYGLQGPREHQVMVTPLSKVGLGSCARWSNPIDLAENLFPTRFGWEQKSRNITGFSIVMDVKQYIL